MGMNHFLMAYSILSLAVSAQMKTNLGKPALRTGGATPSLNRPMIRTITPIGSLSPSPLQIHATPKMTGETAPHQLTETPSEPPRLPVSLLNGDSHLSGGADTPTPPPVDARHAPIVARAKEYITSIMGRRVPTERESEALLEQFLESNNISAESAAAQAVRSGVLPQAAARQNQLSARIDPRISHWSRLLIEIGREHGKTPEYLYSLAARGGQIPVLAGVRSPEVIRNLLSHLLLKDEIEQTLAAYPRNEQGSFLRDVAGQILTKTGKSIEEISRDGAFGYLNFAGQTVAQARSGRDPDAREPHMLFYIQYIEGKWKFSGYRQNAKAGFRGGPDSQYQKILKNWLIAGGVPAQDLL